MVMNPQSRCMRFDPPSRTGFDPSVSCEQGRTLAEVCNSDKIKALHDAFQQLCEANTARIDREFAASGSADALSPTDVCTTASKRFSPEFERVTVFHSKTLAKLSLMELGRIMMRSVGCLEEMLAVAVLLSARYCVSAEVKPTTHLMHRLYVACLQLALKAHSDHYYRNSHYAYLAGISAGEMNRQEAELLRGMCWSAQVTAKQVESAITRVVSGRYMPTLAAFARPAEPFESMRIDEYAKSHGLSQSSMDLPRYPPTTSMAESCPQKIQETLARAEKPLVVTQPDREHREVKPAWNHEAQLRQVRGRMEVDNLDSPRSLGDEEDPSPDMDIIDYS